MTARRTRSFLIAPGNRPDLVMKFQRIGADLSVIDLEDGTPPAEKAGARQALAELVGDVRNVGLSGLLAVRVNDPWSDHYLQDLEAAAPLPIDMLVIPKLESGDHLFPAVHAIRRAERLDPRQRSILAGIESVGGVIHAGALLGSYPEISAMYFGAEDYLTDIGGERTAGSGEVAHARSRVLMFARQAGLAAIDQPIADVRNDALFRRDAEQGKQLGYDGKICLLPRQVEIANEVFSPSGQEIDWGRRLLRAYREATTRGIGTIEFEGKMIDGPLLKRAQRTVDLAGAGEDEEG